MIRTVKIEINAANPQLPLTPAEVFEDSAVTFIIIGVPRAHGKQTITGVSVGVINPDGQATAVEAVRDGSAWIATVHAADIGGSGTVKNGILISASGKDENDSPVEAWILGAGDLVVMQHDGTIKPGERLNRVDWFESAPESPKIGNLAPLDGIIKIYTSSGWTSLGGFVTIDWANVTGKPTEFPPEAHAASHKTGGTDALTPADIGAVAAVSGKQLSTNDYTTAEKTKLAGIEAGAQVNPTPVAPSTEIDEGATADAKKVAEFVNSSINAMAAFYITKNAAGDAFATKAELTAAIASGTFYNGGQLREPTKNDYLYVLADESATQIIPGVNPTTRYSFDGAQWAFQIVVNNTALTSAQVAAINSGMTAVLVSWLVTFKGGDTSTTLASVLSALAGKLNLTGGEISGSIVSTAGANGSYSIKLESDGIKYLETIFGAREISFFDYLYGTVNLRFPRVAGNYTFATTADLSGKAALTDLPYQYTTITVPSSGTSTVSATDGAIVRITSSGYSYLMINPTVTLPVPATNKTAECVLRWNTGSTVHAPTLALPSGKTAQSYSISGDTPEANEKYEMFVQIVPTSTANTYEVISVTRKLA